MTVTLERKGSSKDIYRVFARHGSLRSVRFKFSDRVSVLDLGGIPDTPFADLGRLRCAIAGHLFNRMTLAGFRTHYLSHNIRTGEMDVYPLDIKELDVTYPGSLGRILGIELIDRRQVTKKLVDRVEAGTLEASRLQPSLGDRDLTTGTRLSPPFIECTTKYEDADRYITDDEASQYIGLSTGWLHAMCFEEVRRASDFLSDLFVRAGFDRHDGKFEGGINYSSGKFVFADSISPDEMRLVGRDGKSYDKDPVRQWYQETFPDWYVEVLAAKKSYPLDKAWWPTYPERKPPASVISEVVGRYKAVAEAIGAI